MLSAYGLKSKSYILTVGRLEPRKNHVNLLRAYAQLPQPRPKLVIVGQSDFGFEQIFAISKELPQSDVKFLSAVTDDILSVLYRDAALFVYPTWAEGFGMPVVEAMASGVPVVTSNTTCLPEIGGDAVLLAEPSDSSSIADAIMRLLRDGDLRKKLVTSGLQRAEQFNWNVAAQQVRLAYLEMLGRSQREYVSQKTTGNLTSE
ncbi:MAG TPA: glycosyltransferase family 1 protein [Terriglobales bacterium]|nr:glycosyltransferase family 1 protein [Terriglobales bacterium]